MSTTGEAKDVRASTAKPRLGERVCEHGRRPTRAITASVRLPPRALGRRMSIMDQS
jgi:hypothetical protein